MPINYSKYPPDWKLRSKFIRFYRARNRCEICGVPNYQDKVVLTVMHLDHSTKNNSLLNLVAGCQKCHNNYDTEYRKWNRTGIYQIIKTVSLNDILNRKLLNNYFQLFRKRKKLEQQLKLFKL